MKVIIARIAALCAKKPAPSAYHRCLALHIAITTNGS
jgi:hypothetical protein